MALSITVGGTPPDTDAWDALCDETGASPFQRPGWILPWCSAFANGDSLFVKAALDGRLVGVLPLRRRFRVVTSATNWHTPLFAGTATSAEVQEGLVGTAARQGSALVLRFVPDRSATAVAFTQVCRERDGMSVRSRLQLESPRVEISQAWDEYEKSLSKSMLKTLRRRARRLDEMGKVEVEVVSDPRGAEAALAEGLALETAGWKGRRGTAIAADSRLRQFYLEAVLAAARAGRLSLAFLRLDGRAVAFHLDFIDGEILYGLKGTYAEDLAQVSPSRILRHERIKQAFAQGLRAYEFLGADEPYKADWANAATRLETLEAYSPSPAGRLLELANTHGRASARSLRAARIAGGRRMGEWWARPKPD